MINSLVAMLYALICVYIVLFEILVINQYILIYVREEYSLYIYIYIYIYTLICVIKMYTRGEALDHNATYHQHRYLT